MIWHKITYNHRYATKTYQSKSDIYSIYMFKDDLALNNLQGLICHKTQ